MLQGKICILEYNAKSEKNPFKIDWFLGNCETHNLSLLYMQIKQLLRKYYEVGTKEGPNLLGRFLSTIGI